MPKYCPECGTRVSERTAMIERGELKPRKTKRKLSAWNKFVKANSNKPRFRSMNNTARLKKLGIAYRKTAAYKKGKKKRR